MDHEQADAVAQAIALGIAMAVKPLKQEIADLEARLSVLERKTVPIGAGDQNPFLDPGYSARLTSALEEEARRKMSPPEPVAMMDAPAEPEPPVKTIETQFTKGMMRGSAVYVARAVLPNQEGVVTYKRVDGDLPLITVERPSGEKIRYVPQEIN